MNYFTAIKVKKTCDDLIDLIDKLEKSEYCGSTVIGKNSAAVKRKSMDLTNLLADLRLNR